MHGIPRYCLLIVYLSEGTQSIELTSIW